MWTSLPFGAILGWVQCFQKGPRLRTKLPKWPPFDRCPLTITSTTNLSSLRTVSKYGIGLFNSHFAHTNQCISEGFSTVSILLALSQQQSMGEQESCQLSTCSVCAGLPVIQLRLAIWRKRRRVGESQRRTTGLWEAGLSLWNQSRFDSWPAHTTKNNWIFVSDPC